MFWFRVLAVGQLALLARRHLQKLEPADRTRLAALVKKSKGRPSNLTAADRSELLALVRKLEPGEFGRSAAGHVSPLRRRRPL
ncbi:hypothetical protein HJD18_07560 [Thermoleophilia bacterium SCSIO 60948]|nr:hypothetical protein HJD18_07560 [Thermoleophilia bacterium SCSIO 60948]